MEGWRGGGVEGWRSGGVGGSKGHLQVWYGSDEHYNSTSCDIRTDGDALFPEALDGKLATFVINSFPIYNVNTSNNETGQPWDG